MAKIRPLSNNILIELEPEITKMGNVILPDSGRVSIRIAKVLKCGPGRWMPKIKRRRPIPVEEGQLVAFLMANLQTKQGQAVCYVLEDNQGLIKDDDILFLVDRNIRLDIGDRYG